MILPQSWWLLLFGVALLTLAAIGGYHYGRNRRGRARRERADDRTEVQRALSLVEDLEGVAGRLRKAISQHGSAVRHFTQRLSRCERAVGVSRRELGDRAEELLKQANRLTGEISNAYASLQQQLSHLSAFTELRTDPLTGVANRLAFDEVLSAVLAAQTRHSTPISLAVLDLDFFKQLNESRSILQGDRVLVAFADLLRSLIRPCDTLARYAGEEFVIVMPNTEMSVAAEVAEAIRHDVQTRLAVTVSIGLAASAFGDTCSTLFHRAEAALAKAKGAGRNCVYLHEGTLGRIVGVNVHAPAAKVPPELAAAKTATLENTVSDRLGDVLRAQCSGTSE